MPTAVIYLPDHTDFRPAIQELVSLLVDRGFDAKVQVSPDVDQPIAKLGEDYVDLENLLQQSRTWRSVHSLTFKRLSDTAILPARGSLDCAGLDLYADIPAALKIMPGEVAKISTGWALELPYGHYGQVLDRSSLGSKGLAVRGGVIDRDYRGEIKVLLQYVAPCDAPPFIIRVNDRIAQLAIISYLDVHAVESKTLSPTIRGSGGFGSTGVNIC